MNEFNKTILLLFVFTLIGLYGCNKLDEVGYSLLPEEDKLEVLASDTLNLLVKTKLSPDTLDAYRVTKALLGEYTDPVFGKTTAEFVAELFPGSAYYFNDTMTLDSCILYLTYSDSLLSNMRYGNENQALNFSVHLLSAPLDTIVYPSNQDMSGLYETQSLYTGSVFVNPDDTLIKVTMPNEFAQKIMGLDTIEAFSEFKTQIPGLYFKAEGTNEVITSFNLSASTTRLALYYSKNDIHYTAAFRLHTDFSVNFNLFYHDYTGTEVANALNASGTEDSLIFIQSMNGVRATIDLTNLDALKGNLINEARLFFPLYLNSEQSKYFPIEKLLLLSLKTNGELDYLSEDNGTGAKFDSTTYGYSFNITRYVQQLANENDSLTSTLYLVPSAGKVDFRRTVIDNRNNAIKLSLKITK